MRIFISYSYADAHELAAALSRALTDTGHEVLEPRSQPSRGHLIGSISTAIQTSDVVVALLTVRNPNVYYELGLAAGAHVPTLVAARNFEDMVFDLSSAPYVQLS